MSSDAPYEAQIEHAVLTKINVAVTKAGPIIRLTVDAALADAGDVDALSRELLGKDIILQLTARQFPMDGPTALDPQKGADGG
jgi:hypothetical protein